MIRCVVSLYGSFAECWLLSGGKLAGITEDAVDEHGIEIDDDTALVGTVMEPNLESIAALSPENADMASHWGPVGGTPSPSAMWRRASITTQTPARSGLPWRMCRTGANWGGAAGEVPGR